MSIKSHIKKWLSSCVNLKFTRYNFCFNVITSKGIDNKFSTGKDEGSKKNKVNGKIYAQAPFSFGCFYRLAVYHCYNMLNFQGHEFWHLKIVLRFFPDNENTLYRNTYTISIVLELC